MPRNPYADPLPRPARVFHPRTPPLGVAPVPATVALAGLVAGAVADHSGPADGVDGRAGVGSSIDGRRCRAVGVLLHAGSVLLRQVHPVGAFGWPRGAWGGLVGEPDLPTLGAMAAAGAHWTACADLPWASVAVVDDGVDGVGWHVCVADYPVRAPICPPVSVTLQWFSLEALPALDHDFRWQLWFALQMRQRGTYHIARTSPLPAQDAP